jgi:hypothetical protein
MVLGVLLLGCIRQRLLESCSSMTTPVSHAPDVGDDAPLGGKEQSHVETECSRVFFNQHE